MHLLPSLKFAASLFFLRCLPTSFYCFPCPGFHGRKDFLRGWDLLHQKWEISSLMILFLISNFSSHSSLMGGPPPTARTCRQHHISAQATGEVLPTLQFYSSKQLLASRQQLGTHNYNVQVIIDLGLLVGEQFNCDSPVIYQNTRVRWARREAANRRKWSGKKFLILQHSCSPHSWLIGSSERWLTEGEGKGEVEF